MDAPTTSVYTPAELALLKRVALDFDSTNVLNDEEAAWALDTFRAPGRELNEPALRQWFLEYEIASEVEACGR